MKDLKRVSRVRKAMSAGQGRLVILGAAVAALFAAVGVFHATTHVAVVRAGYDLGKIEARYREQLRENERLKMERATLRSAPRLESIARTRLGMAPPTAGQIMVVRSPSATPTDKVVAVVDRNLSQH